MVNQEEMIKSTFENVKTIYMETSKLLLDVESMMDDGGWCVQNGNAIGTVQSKSINNPWLWFTPYVSRYFISKEGGNIMKAVGVLFMDRNHNPIEPLVVMISLDMKTGKEDMMRSLGLHCVSRMWFQFMEEKTLGVDLVFEGQPDSVFNRGVIRAFPLTELKDQESLRALVVEPLLGMGLKP